MMKKNSFMHGLKKFSPPYANETNGRQNKVVAQQKLHVCSKELQASLLKTKEVFSSFKAQCFFFPEPQFCKEFSESLKQTETAVAIMGNSLSALLSRNKVNVDEEKIEAKEVKQSGKRTSSDSSFNVSTDNADVLAKASLNITPPASEAGNDDDVTAVVKYTLDKAATKKRAHKQKENDKETYKRPRRSLLESYVKEEEEVVETNAEEKPNDANESLIEVEYEVESILGYKKMQNQYFYQVSWKGYGPEDCTWEPSEHLTECKEVLLEFFKSRIIEREKNICKTELFNKLIPLDTNHKQYIVEAFMAQVNNPTPKEKERICKQYFANIKIPATEEEIRDLVYKALSTRTIEKYSSIKQRLREQAVIQQLKEQRGKQLAQLRNWERNMNTVCSDPANIVVENTIDLELPPLDFIYINELKAGQGVTIPNDPLLGCECKDCSETPAACCAKQMNSWFAYNKHGRLKVSLGTPVYECNKRCSCPLTCCNRVVQKGRCFSLSIFRTDNGRGWGVKALEPIKKDSFVVEYVGEVVTSEEAERRGEIYDQKGCTYLFDMDFNNGDQNPYTVDAAKFGNVSHFINHSCDPNLVVFNVWVNCLDPDLPRLALFSCRDIKKGEELTFDYNSGLESRQIKKEGNALSGDVTDDEEFQLTPDKVESLKSASLLVKTPKGNRGLKYGKTECRCGAANCRMYFF